MSRENVEIVRRVYDAAARRDADAAFELYAEDIVWDVSATKVTTFRDRPVYHGHEGVREVWREGLAIFADITNEVEEMIDAGDRVLVVVREREVGRSSGVPVTASHLAVWTLARGMIVRLQVFDDRDEAMKAAGLAG